MPLDWTKVADKKECGGAEKGTGTKKTLAECAKSCREISSMFIYGTNDFGDSICKINDNEYCPCFCEKSSEDGECSMIENKSYNLYKYVNVKEGNKKIYIYINIWKYVYICIDKQ